MGRSRESQSQNGRGGGSRGRKGKNVEWTRAIVPSVTLLVARSFKDKPKGSNSIEHELSVGETMNREKALNDVIERRL
jgi:hypothetical protein